MDVDEDEQKPAVSVSKQPSVDSGARKSAKDTSNKSSPEDEVDDVSIKPDPKKEDNDAMDVDKDEQKPAVSVSKQPPVDSGVDKDDAKDTSNKPSPEDEVDDVSVEPDPKKEDNDAMDVDKDEQKPAVSVSKQPQVDSGAKENLQSKEDGASMDSDSFKDDPPVKIVATAASATEKEVLENDSKAEESKDSDKQNMASCSEDMIVDKDLGKQNVPKEAAGAAAVKRRADEKQGDGDKMEVDKTSKENTVPSKKDIVDDAVATAETASTPPANTNDDVTTDGASRKEEKPTEETKKNAQVPPGDTAAHRNAC